MMKEHLININYQKNELIFFKSRIFSISFRYHGLHLKLRLVMGRSWVRLLVHALLLTASQ